MLDVQTAFVMMLASVFATAAALPVLVGWPVSAGARWMNASALTQALAWACLLLARPVHDRFFSTLWIALLGLSLVCIWHALNAWLAPRPGRAVVHAAALLDVPLSLPPQRPKKFITGNDPGLPRGQKLMYINF